MPDIPGDGKTRVSWVSTISNQVAPTVSELNAGIDITPVLTADGLSGFQPDTAKVDTSSLASTYDSATVGRVSFGNPKLRGKKQSGTDTMYSTLTYGTSGYLAVRRSVAYGTAWASTQAVQVYPAICGETAWMDPEPNTVERYEIPIIVNSAASIRAVVA